MRTLEADYVIVGTGAGGATAGRVLSMAGRSVLFLEEGPLLGPEERPHELANAMPLTIRDVGTQATSGLSPIVLLQGRLVGGSTAVNSAIMWRLPEDVRRTFVEEHGLAALCDAAALERVYETLERELEVAPTAATMLGGNGRRMAEGARLLGLHGRPTTRNAGRCEGRSRCLQGCPGGARTSMDVSYVPMTLAHGGALESGARAERVLVERQRAVGVVARRTSGEKIVARARLGVIVAAGAVHTPLLLHESGVFGLAGQRFQAHPGSAVVGRFPERIDMASGATQSYEVPMHDRGYKLESLSLPPELMAARIPGAGAEWVERIAAIDHCAQWVAAIKMEAMGRVRRGLFGPRVDYAPTRRDLRVAKDAVLTLCRMMFAAGAVEVYPGIARAPDAVRSMGELDAIERLEPRADDFHLVASHLFGTACAGNDPSRSVVGERLEAHAIKRLYVMDASVLPTNTGVNPQQSIMALAYRGASFLANESSRSLAA